ncbi:hypothetical protein [Salinisphaera japonica]|uniref:hypothetical protein n=1 Tax=Salinisphaera japonica TaxID=1304270 RepID=UPI000F4B8594|nr:hypothetical protein [Salinisphaera japonica]
MRDSSANTARNQPLVSRWLFRRNVIVVLLVLALLGIAPWIQALYASWVGVGMIALVHAEVEPETPQRFTANLKRFLRSQVWPALHAQGSLEMVDERSPSLDGRGQNTMPATSSAGVSVRICSIPCSPARITWARSHSSSSAGSSMRCSTGSFPTPTRWSS